MCALGQPEEARSAFQARIRQLQRIGLLKKPDGKAYERFTYGLVELAALATAFRLMAAFMLPSLAVRYLTERWGDFVPALLGGLGGELAGDRWGDDTYTERYIAIEGVALARLGQKGANDTRYDGPLGLVVAYVGEATLDRVSETGVPQGVVVATRGYMTALVSELRKLDFLSSEQIADEIDRLRFSAL